MTSPLRRIFLPTPSPRPCFLPLVLPLLQCRVHGTTKNTASMPAFLLLGQCWVQVTGLPVCAPPAELSAICARVLCRFICLATHQLVGIVKLIFPLLVHFSNGCSSQV